MIEAYSERDREAVVACSLRAWAPVFEGMRAALPPFLYDAFYPDGWQTRQAAEVGAFVDEEGEHVLVARQDDVVVGWVGYRMHSEDSMGEIVMIAVEPDRQRQGIARQLVEAALARFRDAGMTIAMIETGGDPGHAPARAAYDRLGFELWSVARFVRPL